MRSECRDGAWSACLGRRSKPDNSDLTVVVDLGNFVLHDLECSVRRESASTCTNYRKRNGAISTLTCDAERATNAATDRSLGRTPKHADASDMDYGVETQSTRSGLHRATKRYRASATQFAKRRIARPALDGARNALRK